jgi:hypothetical protein
VQHPTERRGALAGSEIDLDLPGRGSVIITLGFDADWIMDIHALGKVTNDFTISLRARSLWRLVY